MRIGVALVLLPGNGKSITSCCHSRWSAFTSGTVFSNLSSQEIQTRFTLCTFALKGPRFKLISAPKHSGCKTCKTSVQSSCRGETVLSLLLAAGSCWPGFWVLNFVQYILYSKPKASLNQNWLASELCELHVNSSSLRFCQNCQSFLQFRGLCLQVDQILTATLLRKFPPPLMHFDILCEACL